MLQFIRSKAGSVVVKILFALLIFAFGIWGIGDIFRQKSAAETTVARIGDIKIQADALQTAVRDQIERMRPLYGANFDFEQAKQMGLIDAVLDGLINESLIDQEQQKLRLALDDQVVRDSILANPAFHGFTGTFDRNLFLLTLSNNHLTEDRFVATLRRDMLRGELTSAVTGGASAPGALADPIYRTRNEKRVADTVFIAADTIKDVAAPSDAELEDYYGKHEDQFRSPEYRAITLLSRKPEDLTAGITVPEDKLRAEYDDRLADFQAPERRELEQIIVPDEAKAKEVEDQLAAGKDFVAVAKDVANQDEEAIKLGKFGRDELPPAMAEAAFGLAQGGVSKPVQDPLGWHIVRVVAIEGGGTKPLDEVRQQLTADVALKMAAEQIAKEENEVEDALGGGAPLDQVAERFKLKLTKVEAVDLDGHAPKGDPVELPDPEVLRVAFATEKGQTSRLTDTKDNGFFLLDVSGVTPAAVQPLASVKEKAIGLLLAERRSAAAEAQAKEIVASIASGKSLADIAGERHLTVTTTPAVTRRGGGQANLPASLVNAIFALKQSESTVSQESNGWYVAQLKSIDIPDPAADKPAVAQVSDQLANVIRNDLLSQFEKALRGRFSVDVNRGEIDRLL